MSVSIGPGCTSLTVMPFEPEIARPTPRIGGDSGLGRRIVGDAWPGRGVAEDRSDRDDPAAFLEHAGRGPHGGCHAANIDRKLPLQFGAIVGPVLHDACGKDGRVVDENIEATELLSDFLDEIFDLFFIRLIGLESLGAHALGFELVHDTARLGGGARVTDHDIGSLVGER